jgi:uncharacterized membrane protein
MRTKEFLTKLEHDRIVQAIRDAEAKTSGEIRIYIQRGKVTGDPLSAARKQFQRLGMYRTSERNAVLVFVAPRARKFAVVADTAIHEKSGDALWQRLVGRMQTHFRDENFTDALVGAIAEVGHALAAHFPKSSTSTELPDQVIED